MQLYTREIPAICRTTKLSTSFRSPIGNGQNPYHNKTLADTYSLYTLSEGKITNLPVSNHAGLRNHAY